MRQKKLITAVFMTKSGAHVNSYGFIDARDVFNVTWFTGEKRKAERYLDYCAERNKKDGWTEDTVIEELSKVTI